MQSEERSQFEILKAQMYAERAAKRDRRPKRARAMVEDETPIAGWKYSECLLHGFTNIPQCKHFVVSLCISQSETRKRRQEVSV